MKKISPLIFLFLLVPFLSISQETNFNVFNIPSNLKEDAHSFVWFNNVNVELKSSKTLKYTVKRAITVFNKQGDRNKYVVIG